MGKLKLLRFGFGAPELFSYYSVHPRSQGDGFENSLRNMASNHGLAYLVSPQLGQFWRTLVILKPTLLQYSKWSGYKHLKNSNFDAYHNFQIVDKSTQEKVEWQECLGYPGLKLLMKRPEKIKIKYETQKKFQESKAEKIGFEARVMQQAEDHLQAIDPLMLAKDISVIDDSLRVEHEGLLKQLFVRFVAQRSKQQKFNPYRRSLSFNRLRRQIMYNISDVVGN